MTAGRSTSVASRIFILPCPLAAIPQVVSPSSVRGLEKDALECWLKLSRVSLADAKAWTDFRLRSAKNFHVDLTGFFQQGANGASGKAGRVAVATQMPEDDTFNFAREQFFDHGGS